MDQYKYMDRDRLFHKINLVGYTNSKLYFIRSEDISADFNTV